MDVDVYSAVYVLAEDMIDDNRLTVAKEARDMDVGYFGGQHNYITRASYFGACEIKVVGIRLASRPSLGSVASPSTKSFPWKVVPRLKSVGPRLATEQEFEHHWANCSIQNDPPSRPDGQETIENIQKKLVVIVGNRNIVGMSIRGRQPSRMILPHHWPSPQ